MQVYLKEAAEKRAKAFRDLVAKFKAMVDAGKLQVEVRNGLAEGEQIVVVGGNTLRDGMTVRAVGAGGGPAGGAASPAGEGPGRRQPGRGAAPGTAPTSTGGAPAGQPSRPQGGSR